MLHSTIKPPFVSPRVKPSLLAGIEPLEARIAPAGVVNVTLTDGVLTITGDGADNRVEVSSVIGNQVLVAGLNGTLLNGASASLLFEVPAKGLASITAELGAGNDDFTLRDLLVKGDVTVTDGDGGISMQMRDLNARNFTLSGSDATDSLSSGGMMLRGNFTLELGGGTNFASLSGVSKILGALSYSGTGSDWMNLTDVDVKRGVGFEFGGSQGRADFYGTANIQGGMRVASTANLLLTMNTDVAKIAGDVIVGLGAGENLVDLIASISLDVRGRLQVTGGSGDDELSFSGYRVNVTGGVTFDAGGGENTFGQASALFSTSTLKVNGGAGIDLVDLSDSVDTTIKGLASFSLGDGENTFTAPDLIGTVSLGSFTYTGGEGRDRIASSKAWLVRGASQIELGAGANTLDITSRSATFGGRLEVHSASVGLEESTIRIEASTVAALKGVFITQTGDAVQTMYMNGGYSLVIKGGLTYESGAGSDSVSFNFMRGGVSGPISVNAGGGNNDVEFEVYDTRVSAPINVTTGAGNDSIHFQTATATFAAPINVFAGAGDNEMEFAIEFGRTDYLKPVKVVSDSAGTDSLELRNASFKGGLDVRLGGGVSTVEIDDVAFRGKTVIDTAAGNDSMLIERNGTAAVSLFASAVDLKLGEGDDSVLIGGGTLANTIRLIARLTIDGGAGTDTSNDVAGFAQYLPGGSVNLLQIP